MSIMMIAGLGLAAAFVLSGIVLLAWLARSEADDGNQALIAVPDTAALDLRSNPD